MSRFEDVTATQGKAPSHSPPDTRYAPGIRTARKLGWFSIGLGAAELLFPRMMGRATGIQNESLLTACGLREIACGIGLLTSSRPTSWLWARVAGDAMDLAALGAVVATGDDEDQQAAALAAAAVAGVAAADIACGMSMSAAARLEG